MGLGKSRTIYGEFLDRHNIKQEDIAKITRLSRATVSEACSKEDFYGTRSSRMLLVMAAGQLSGIDVKESDFW